MALTVDFSFYDIFPELGALTIVDVGAALTAKPPFYQALVDAGHAEAVGFEPNPAFFEKLTQRTKSTQRNYPYFIGDGTPGTFHETTFGFSGSLFPVNHAVIQRFTHLPAYMHPVGVSPVITHRLDDVLPDAEIDMLKIDVQGGELAVLRGAPRLLPTALLIETEVEFIPLYEGQPMFADVDIFMRSAGFQLHTFHEPGKYFYAPASSPKAPLTGVNQVVFTDAVYIPDLSRAVLLPRERLLKLVALLHNFYKSWDLGLHLLKALAERGEPEPFQRYAARLGLA